MREYKKGPKSQWVNEATTTIRVPICFKDLLIDIAKELDSGNISSEDLGRKLVEETKPIDNLSKITRELKDIINSIPEDEFSVEKARKLELELEREREENQARILELEEAYKEELKNLNLKIESLLQEDKVLKIVENTTNRIIDEHQPVANIKVALAVLLAALRGTEPGKISQAMDLLAKASRTNDKSYGNKYRSDAYFAAGLEPPSTRRTS